MVRNEIFRVEGFGQYTLTTRVFTIPNPSPEAAGRVVTLPGTRWESTGPDGVWRYWWVYKPRPGSVAEICNKDVSELCIDGVPELWIIDHLRRAIGFRPLRPEPRPIRRIQV